MWHTGRMPSDTNGLVTSHKNVYYVRPEIRSRWLGPPDDRIWVPALDWPEDLAPPPDPELALENAGTPHEPQVVAGGTPHPVPQQASHQRPDYGAFSGSAGMMPPFRNMAAPAYGTVQATPTAQRYGEFMGPFANTMAHRDRGLEHRHATRTCAGVPRTPTAEDGTITARSQDGATPKGGPDRAKEQHLREHALHSKNTVGAKPEVQPTCPVPNVDHTLRHADGHPIPPMISTTEDESDYGSSDADEKSELQKFRTCEHDRFAKVLARTGGTPVSEPISRAPDAAGLWEGVSVDSIPNARNQVWWWSHRCPKACAFAKFLMKVYGDEQLRRRSDGMQYILRHASSANQSYLGAATGDSTPLSCQDPNTVSRQARRKFKKECMRREEMETEVHAGMSGTPTTESSIDYDDPMPPARPEAPSANPIPATPVAASFSGTSPIRPAIERSMTMHWLGPQLSLHEAMAHAATERPIDWVQGVQTAAGAWPMAGTPIGTFPMASDLRAAQLLHFLARLNQDSVHRDAWMALVLHSFSVWGVFERHVQLGEWVGGSHTLEHYPFDAINITYSQSMQWVHAHGVDRASTAAHEFHAFTTSWRNLSEGLPTATGQQFVGHEIENAESVLRWDAGRITNWATLWRGPLCPGQTNSYPRHPADTSVAGARGAETTK
ncbi:hypothetical protein K438DRAFT_1768509 [Mycena galopus ATCC 62051]|nr:hypothetical protein K438DRAFT_1768509 [Mycena galopus ATCC 62051]